jgi:hypothetical protein
MADTPILDGLRETIAGARPNIIGKLVIKLAPADGSALEREINQLGVALPDVTIVKSGRFSELEIDGAAAVWRHG